MEDSKFSSMLVFFVGNYFVTFFTMGLVAAAISLAKKPKPLRISEVSEALFSYYLLFALSINNLINFVFHVLFGGSVSKTMLEPARPRAADQRPEGGPSPFTTPDSRTQWVIFAAAFMISACTTGIMSAM
jgi:hypothetical protein